MTDTDKLIAARRALAQIADQCTAAVFDAAEMQEAWQAMRRYGEALVSIREMAQDAAEATLETVRRK